MKRTVIGVFDRYSDAQRAAEQLAGLDIDRGRIHLKTAARQFDGDAGSTASDHEILDGIRSFFTEIFGPDLSSDDPRRYAEAIQRGSAVVVVEIGAESELEKVRESLRKSGASRIGGSDPSAASARADDEPSPEMQRCIEACRACHKTCLQLAMNQCLELEGKYLEPEHFRLLLNCAEICHTTANFMISRSHLHPLLCGVCAEVCAKCASSCEAVGDMASCVQQCRDCSGHCRQIAEAAA
jgi:hypothetical protein